MNQISLLSHSDIERLASHNPALSYLVRLSKSSRVTVQSCLMRIAAIAGYHSIEDCPWSELRRDHVYAILEFLRQADLAPATISLYLAIIKSVAEEAWNMELMEGDAYQRIKSIKGARGSRLPKGRALNINERAALFAACDADDSAIGPRDAAILALLLGCGLRRSEASSLTLSSLCMEERFIQLIGKGDKERKVYIPEFTHQRLSNWIAQRNSDCPFLFLRARRIGKEARIVDQGLTSQAIYYILNERRKQAGIGYFTPHDLRRTYATMLFENNEDVMTVKNLMGHSSIATTQLYDMRGEEAAIAAVNNLELVPPSG